ncbi:MAG: chromosomal replication initiator protein DnaA [Oscillospiraceae bacterium]|jgi:chromosomal replication initiator protein|nr:chromosomal replication initiator protein DnaA [Oscillospiraceae bacterium]
MYTQEELWNHILAELARDNSRTVLRTWFEDMQILKSTPEHFVLYTPPAFKRDIVQRRYLDRIRDILEGLQGGPVLVEILTEEELEEYRRREHLSEETSEQNLFTFDRFVVGSSNKFAHAAAQAVADAPAKAYNPLFIYGGSGLGKTHLLYAVMDRISQLYPSFTIHYVTGEQFTSELVTAIRVGKNYEFHETYRKLDVLLVDDIQFIAGKDFSQEEFFYTFNALYESGHQIVLTSDRPPKDMNRLEDRLRSRFEWGLIADIQPPDFETRMAIVNAKAARLGLTVSEDVAEYIANTITANVRQLEGTVKKMLAYRDLMHSTLDLESAKRAISDIVRESPGLAPTPQLILEEVCSYYALDPALILSANRRADLVTARQAAMYLCRLLTDRSLHDIGKFFKRDHTTISHGCERVEQQKSSDPAFARDLQTIVENIKSR